MRKSIAIIIVLMLCNSLGYAQTTHVVQRGETYDLIARRYGIPLSELMAANPDSDGCFVGMEVNIPEGRKKTDHIVTVTPRDMSLLDDASHYVKDGKYKKATSAYSDVIKVSPSAAAYFGRGISYYNREKYKSAIEDFEMAQRSRDCTSDMKERCKQLISNAESLRAEQHERRNSFWGSLAAVVVGAAAVTASAALAADNSGSAMYMPPSKMNGFQRDTSMDYLLDPRYAIMQVQQEEMAEYQQFKQLTGQDITLEQYRYLKYSSNDSTTGRESVSGSESPSSSSSSSNKRISSSAKECPQCHGTGRMEYNTNPAQFGMNNNYKVRCNECGKEVLKSWGHTHITCKICHGKGTI